VTARIIPFPRPTPEPDGDEFEEVTRAGDQAEALVVKSLLEAYGVRVLLRTHVAQSVHPFTVGDQGEVRILVPRPDVAESRRLLARLAPDPEIPGGGGPSRCPPGRGSGGAGTRTPRGSGAAVTPATRQARRRRRASGRPPRGP
jgi:hypothetical protein